MKTTIKGMEIEGTVREMIELAGFDKESENPTTRKTRRFSVKFANKIKRMKKHGYSIKYLAKRYKITASNVNYLLYKKD